MVRMLTLDRPSDVGTPRAAGRPRPVGRRPVVIRWVPSVAGGVFGLVLFWVAHRGMSDDAYITLAFAQNVALRGELAVTPGLLSNTATSPAQVLLLALVTLVTRSPVVAVGVVLIASLAVISAVTSATARRCGWAWWAGPVAAALLATSPLMSSTLGLESFLLLAVLCGLLHAVVVRNAFAVGAAAALMVLTRPDAGVIAVVATAALIIGAVSVRDGVRATGRVALAGTVVGAPWVAFSVWLFGTPVPDTLAWKIAQTDGLGGRFFGDAVPMFLEYWTAATTLSVGLIILGVAALFGWLQAVPTHPVTLILGGGGIAHFTVMSRLEVPPFTWYYAPATGCAALLVAFGLAAVLRRSDGPPVGFALGAPVALLIAAAAMFTWQHDYVAKAHPFHANYATPAEYKRIADSVPAGAVLETAHGEVGALAFFCECTVVDPLSDRGRLSPVISEQLVAEGRKARVLRLLYTRWEPTLAVPAQLQTRAGGPAEPGFPVRSGFGGPGTIAVVPVVDR